MWWPRSFRGGGCVIGRGSTTAARVRLRFRRGPTLEDTVDDGVVLLIADARGLRPQVDLRASGLDDSQDPLVVTFGSYGDALAGSAK